MERTGRAACETGPSGTAATLPASDGARRTASPPGPRSDRRGARPYPGADGARAEPLRARRLLAALVGALRLQALGPAPEAAPVERRGRPAGAGRECRGDRPR